MFLIFIIVAYEIGFLLWLYFFSNKNYENSYSKIIELGFVEYKHRNKIFEENMFVSAVVRLLICSMISVVLLGVIYITLTSINMGGYVTFSLVLGFVLNLGQMILVDLLLGDCLADYFFNSDHKTLKEFKKYITSPESHYSLLKIARAYGIKGFSIVQQGESDLYYVGKRYYVLFSREKDKVLVVVDEKEIYKEHLSSLPDGANASKKIFPFCIVVDYKDQKLKMCRAIIDIFQKDNQICIESQKKTVR